jgi:DNA-binding CsgD family transcriptional regulator
MDETERFTELIGDIYDAALNPALWRPVLGKARSLVGGAAATLYWKDAVNKCGDISYDYGVDPHYKKLYFEKYIKIDPLTSGQFFARLGEPVSTTDVIAYDEFLDTRIYKEWAQPQGVADFITAALDKTATRGVFFGVFRHERNGLVDEDVRRRMRLIVPHMQRAALVAQVIDLKTTQAATFAATLDGLSAGVFLVDARGWIVHANVSARALLADGVVTQGVSGRLTFRDAHATRILGDAFLAAGNGDAGIGTKGIAVPMIALTGERYVAHLLPLNSGAREATGKTFTAVAAVFVHKAETSPPPAPEVIARAYKLTPTELRVLLAVVDVGGVSDVAEALGVAPNTVKTHLARLYEKTEACRQADLVKLVAKFASPLI